MTFSTVIADPNYAAPYSFNTVEQRFRRVGVTDDELQLMFDSHQRKTAENRQAYVDTLTRLPDSEIADLLADWRGKNAAKPAVQSAAGVPDLTLSVKDVLAAVGDNAQVAAATAAAERSGQNRASLLADLDKIASA